ncbi:TetR/AcrR family transcriptional regulator [Microbacterium saperdae]
MSKIDREQIVDAARQLIVADGETAVAMRPIAARLGVTPMALYRYFPDRDALLLALVEKVSEDLEVPGPSTTPRETSVVLALCLHDFLVTHPWMIRLISTGRLASPAGLEFPEGFLSCARDAGLDDTAGFVFYRTMFATILGQATITAARAQSGGAGALPRDADSVSVPLVASLASQWRALDAAASPAAVFGAVAALLPAS